VAFVKFRVSGMFLSVLLTGRPNVFGLCLPKPLLSITFAYFYYTDIRLHFTMISFLESK
jgi:hypothetical protein